MAEVFGTIGLRILRSLKGGESTSIAGQGGRRQSRQVGRGLARINGFAPPLSNSAASAPPPSRIRSRAAADVRSGPKPRDRQASRLTGWSGCARIRSWAVAPPARRLKRMRIATKVQAAPRPPSFILLTSHFFPPTSHLPLGSPQQSRPCRLHRRRHGKKGTPRKEGDRPFPPEMGTVLFRRGGLQSGTVLCSVR